VQEQRKADQVIMLFDMPPLSHAGEKFIAMCPLSLRFLPSLSERRDAKQRKQKSKIFKKLVLSVTIDVYP